MLLRDSLYRYVIAKKTASPVWWIAPALWDAGSTCQVLSAFRSSTISVAMHSSTKPDSFTAAHDPLASAMAHMAAETDAFMQEYCDRYLQNCRIGCGLV